VHNAIAITLCNNLHNRLSSSSDGKLNLVTLSRLFKSPKTSLARRVHFVLQCNLSEYFNGIKEIFMPLNTNSQKKPSTVPSPPIIKQHLLQTESKQEPESTLL
jgi:hypothetical protein